MRDYKSLPPPHEPFRQPEDAHLHRLQDEVLRKVRARQVKPRGFLEKAWWFTPAHQMGLALVAALGVIIAIWPATQRVSTRVDSPSSTSVSRWQDPQQANEAVWAAQLPTAPEVAHLAEAYLDDWQDVELAALETEYPTQNASLSTQDAEAMEAYLMESSPLEQLQELL
jgi:hypothetical protein